MAPGSNHSGVSDSSSDGGFFVAPASASAIQGISIRHHWRLFFESTLGKFGLESHIHSTTPDADHDGEWRRVDSCVVNWILATVSKDVFDIVRRDRHDAFSLWHAVESLFQDNELQRAVFLETELRSLQQGDMSINDYCTKLKRLADQLRDIGHPVSEPSQVLNLLHGLSPKYRYVKPVITSKYPSHSFQSARSFLILEELSAQHDANAKAGQALAVTHGDNSNHGSSNSAHGGNKDGSSYSTAPRTNSGSNNRSNSRQDRRGGRGRGNSGAPCSNNPNSTTQSAPWAAGYNPWQGMVHAWPMPFWAPGAGVLGPRPPFNRQQAMTATHPTAPMNGSAFDTSALYAAL
ncbi:uncharacterized protein [Miscanthus floridulus]|uniref:uncharacterized protein n=1 Tax=Miscanthus floridulus TaxID=154761 RepID=UPI00345791A2